MRKFIYDGWNGVMNYKHNPLKNIPDLQDGSKKVISGFFQIFSGNLFNIKLAIVDVVKTSSLLKFARHVRISGLCLLIIFSI